MKKNIFATFGILAVLLLTLGMTSAAVNTFSLNIVGDGTTSSRLTGINDSSNPFTVSVNNTNTTLSFYVNWTVAATTTMALPLGNDYSSGTDTSVSTFDLTMPYKASSYVQLTAHVYDTSDHSIKYGTETVNVYFDNTDYVTPVEIEGCTDSEANNYNPSATTDDGSCTYDTISSDTLCELEGHDEDGNLEITDFDVNNKGEGSDDEWEFLDQIEITVDVENTGDDDIEDVEVMIMILDDKIENGGNDVTNDFDFEDEVLDDMGKLKDDEEDSVIFTIDELPSDLDDGTYYMYIMTYEDGNEDEQCISEIDNGDFYYSFTVESVDYDESIVVRGTEFKEVVDTYCDAQNLEITIPVYNLGDDEEERVLVNLYDPGMNIDEYMVIKDLDNGDKEIVTFFIDIPSDLTKEKYDLDVIVSFDWDDDEDDEDPLSYDEETTDTSIRLNIIECKAKAPTITASLDSATQMGEDLVVKTTIRNNGKLNSFIISTTGFDSWADLVSVTPGQLEIASGNTQEVLITLTPKQSGAQTFVIQTVVDGETYNQPVSVNIKEKPGILPNLGVSNTVAYLIMAVSTLLVLIFLVLITRIARRPVRAAEF